MVVAHKDITSCAADASLPTGKREECKAGYRPNNSVGSILVRHSSDPDSNLGLHTFSLYWFLLLGNISKIQ